MKAELIVINIYRRDRGLPELTYSEKLGEIANYKAQDLSITWPKLPPKGDPHIDSKGRGVGLRDQEMGLTDWLVAGENVEVNNYTDSDINKEAQSVIDAWDASPEHKAIMVGEWDYAAFGNYKDLNNGREFAVLEVEKSVNYKPAPKSTPTKSTSPSNSPAPSSEPSPTIVPTEKPTPAPTPEPTLAPSVSPAVLIFPRRKPIKNYGRKLPKAA